MVTTIEFKNSRGEIITGVLKEKKSSDQLIIVSHGLNSSKEHPALESISDQLYELGYSILLFDFSKSAHGFNLKEQVSDIHDVTVHFKTYKSFIILTGSFGALSGVIAAAKLPKIKSLITLNGFFGSGQLGRKVLKIYILFRIASLWNQSHKRNWKFFKENYKPKQMVKDVLVIHAEDDKEVFMSQSKSFFNSIAGKKELYILKHGDHHLTISESKKEVVMVINQWLKTNF